jgi:hypothetical protein
LRAPNMCRATGNCPGRLLLQVGLTAQNPALLLLLD